MYSFGCLFGIWDPVVPLARHGRVLVQLQAFVGWDATTWKI
jgi:hypothetical protein